MVEPPSLDTAFVCFTSFGMINNHPSKEVLALATCSSKGGELKTNKKTHQLD
jgi:hypothetical protein